MENKTFIRTNGRGNAWAVLMGQDHPFYDRENSEDVANASFSVLNVDVKSSMINSELLIDAGHGTVQYLLKTNNRIPEAIILTHPHLDHTLGIDWIIQSYFRTHNMQKKYPVYATNLCRKITLETYPHLIGQIEFKELEYGRKTIISEVSDVVVTAYPVYHGDHALGAASLLFQIDNKKALFTGDILCPLFRKKDYKDLKEIDIVYTDANNRFSYPESNHWSVTPRQSDNDNDSEILKKWKRSVSLTKLLSPHLEINGRNLLYEYFDEFLKEQHPKIDLPLTIIDFAKITEPRNIALIHYSGSEDEKHYKAKRINSSELENWANHEAKNMQLKSRFFVPFVGDMFEL